VLLKVTPYMTAHNMTHPYGKLLNYKFEKDYKIHGEGMERQLAILLVNSAVAKRQKLKRKEDTKETKAPTQEVLKVKMKTVPIICDIAVEPWCKDILLWLKNHEGRDEHPLAFNFTEMTAQNIVKRCLGDFDPSIHPHSLRHFRSTHLQKNYHLDPYELASITGWTMKNVLAAKGQQASSMMDVYIHVNWEDLIPKLNVPLLNAI
jgi:integrase